MDKTCTTCGQKFEITKDDLAFYEKASPVLGGKTYTIPPPTLCPDCRVQRRMARRNDRVFYHRKSDLSGKPVIAIYPEDSPFKIYHQNEWYSDKWDPLSFGRDVDLNRPFLEQWAQLRLDVPRLAMDGVNCENSDYCNYCGDDKNCYLDIAGEGNEDCYFDLFTKYSKNCVDCTFVYHSTLCYECIQCHNCYDVRFSMHMDNCSSSVLCFDCIGCRDCLLSTNLRNKQYYILNQPHTKEEYEAKLKELNLSSYTSLKNVFNLWKGMRIKNGIYRDMYNLNCEECIGDNMKNSKNCTHCFNATACRDCKYLYDVLDATDCQDLNYSLYKPECSYELCSTLQLKFSAFNQATHYSSQVYYCDLTNNSSHLFGCIGLNHKEYCVLNKQYTKEEYEEIVPKIIEGMKRDGSWGEFFPVALSPFAYNETVAQEYMPLSKEDVLARGWKWKEEEAISEKYLGPVTDIPDDIHDVADSLSSNILKCEVSGKLYKIIPQELKFYKQMGLPVPRRCPDQRHKDRLTQRNPRHLWDRTCAQCSKSIKTTYSPERPEIVFCEDCYRKKVY